MENYVKKIQLSTILICSGYFETNFRKFFPKMQKNFVKNEKNSKDGEKNAVKTPIKS